MINVRGLPYFAYGSNLSVEGMAVRCPSATRVGRARLDGWRLTFRGVADVEPASEEVVEGALWTVTPKDVRSLDHYEGAPHMYDREVVEVAAEGGRTVKAFTYVMTDRSVVGLPTPYYYGIIERGYVDFGIEVSLLERSLSDLRARHSLKPVAYYEPVGKKRLMAVLEDELEDEFEEDDLFLGSMSPATRALYDLEKRTERERGRTIPLSRFERQSMRVGEYA